MSRITTEATTILRRVVQMAQLIRSVERHLLEDQAEDLFRATSGNGGITAGHGDPTPGMVTALAPHAARERELWAAIRAVSTALDQAEMKCVRLLQGETPEDPSVRCPGWNNELRTRLGGCGKPIEHWTDTNGRQHNRSTLLCTSCRKAEERANQPADRGAA
jgi:hypothetical protein